MKKVFFLFIFYFFCDSVIHAQSSKSNAGGNSPITVDSIFTNSSVCVGNSVTSFTVTFIRQGICMSKNVIGPCFFGVAYKSGDIILAENILATDVNGKQIKLPSRKFVVK